MTRQHTPRALADTSDVSAGSIHDKIVGLEVHKGDTRAYLTNGTDGSFHCGDDLFTESPMILLRSWNSQRSPRGDDGWWAQVR